MNADPRLDLANCDGSFIERAGTTGDILAATIYDKSTRALLRDMLAAFDLKPGQVFTAQSALKWFADNYPKLRSTTINAHLVQASTNNKNRLHHPSTNASDDLLFRVDRGVFRLYDPVTDPAPIHERVAGEVIRQSEDIALGGDAEEDDEDGDDDTDTASGSGGRKSSGDTEFLLEKDLQLYLARHLDRIEPGLKLFDDEGAVGLEFSAGGGRRIDILAIDASGGLVVIELKVSKGYEKVVGQLLRYRNWVKMNIAEKAQRVRGIIICRTMTEDLRLACAGIPISSFTSTKCRSASRVSPRWTCSNTQCRAAAQAGDVEVRCGLQDLGRARGALSSTSIRPKKKRRPDKPEGSRDRRQEESRESTISTHGASCGATVLTRA